MLKEMYVTLRRLREAAARDRVSEQELREDLAAIVEKDCKNLRSVSVRSLFVNLVEDGHEAIELYRDPESRRYTEAASEVNTSLFANTMGQIIYSTVLEAYNKIELIGDQLVTIVPTNFSGEKIPGVTRIGDEVEVVREGEPYPSALVAESYVETPETIKRGLMIDVTKEAVFFDRTGLILNRAAAVGEEIAVNREKRILDVVLGVSTVYRRNGGAAEATYSTDNTSTSNALIDWQSIDTAEVKFAQITDPDTGEPIEATPNTIIVPPELRVTARRIVNATMTNSDYQPNASAGTPNTNRETRTGGNSLMNTFSIASNQYVKTRGSSATNWWYGDPRGAFLYMENWPMTVETQGATSEQAFDRDIVSRSKASERGAAAVLERRKMLKATA